MQKYSPISDDTPNMQEDSEHGTYCWYADALDEIQKRNERISALESSLQECAFALTKQREALHKWDGTIDIAIENAKKALSVGP